MKLQQFRTTLRGNEPEGLTPPLRALWWAGHGDWARAHDLANAIDSPTGAWIHAHLHRQEGDLSNARYWYDRAGKPEFIGSIDAEWDSIVSELVGLEG
jgi:hypothetical protein